MLTQAIRKARDVIARIREPRVLKLVFLAYYVVAIYTGLVTLVRPPTSIEGVLGFWLTLAWSVFILFGGAASSVAVLPGWWWLERIGHIGICVGAGIYGSVVLYLQFSSTGSRLTQLGIIVMAMMGAVIRWVMIRGFDFEPRG